MREWGSRERTTGDIDNWCLPWRRGRGDCPGLRWRRGQGTSRFGGVSDEGATVVIVTKAGSGGFFGMGNGEARTRCDRLRAPGGGGTRSSGVRSSVDLSGRVGSTSDNDNEAATAEADSMATESPATTAPATT